MADSIDHADAMQKAKAYRDGFNNPHVRNLARAYLDLAARQDEPWLRRTQDNFIPYTKAEQRVCDLLNQSGMGCGDDPIGFLIASYAYLVARQAERKE